MHNVHQLANGKHRPDQHTQEGIEGHELSERQLTVEHKIAPVAKPDKIRYTHENFDRWFKKSVNDRYGDIFSVYIVRHRREIAFTCFFLYKSPNNTNTCNGFQYAVIHLPKSILCENETLMDATPINRNRYSHDRQRQNRSESQLPANEEAHHAEDR
ncbi:hypothetical protein D3C86_1670300 [compost metagenome]